MPNFKMTYPYDRVFPGLGRFEPDEVVAFEENPAPHFFEETTDPVWVPNEDGIMAPPATPAALPVIPDASGLAAPAAAKTEGN